MSTTAIAALPNQLPAHLQNRARGSNIAAMGGIRAGGFATIGIKGSKFFLKNEGETVLITDPNNPELPKMQLELVVVGFNPVLNKIFYDGDWEEGSTAEPDCSSDDGITPDPHIASPIAAGCAVCPNNQWGSKINKQGKQVKACSDNKRLVVLRSDDLQGIAMALNVTPGGLKNWAEYVRLLDTKGIDVTTVSTKVQFDPTASHPKLLFKFDRFLTEEEQAYVDERATTDEVRLISMPRKSQPTPSAPAVVKADQPKATVTNIPLRAVAPVNTLAAEPAKQAAAPVAPVVEQAAPTPVAGWQDGLPAAIVSAVMAVGGPDSDAGLGVIRSIKPDYQPVVAEPPKPVDPFEGLPAHVKPAVDAVGGLGTVAGSQVFAALAGKPAPVQAEVLPQVDTKKRAKKAQATTDATVPPKENVTEIAKPVYQLPKTNVTEIAKPVMQQPALSTGPVVGAGGLGAELENLLAAAMSGTLPG